MKKLMLVGMLLCFGGVLAQNSDVYDPDYLKENTPASPETSSLGTYGDVSNNPYNGKLNLGVPLHSINFEGLIIPINLSYDSGGMRPAQESSWVGLNWSLSGRAQITRSIYGNDDLNESVIPNTNGELSALPFNDFEVSYDSNGLPNIPLNEIIDIHEGYLIGGGGSSLVAPHLSPDTQPDIYEVNLFGISYRFRFDKRVGTSNTLTTHILDNNNARIEYNLSTQTFHVWDDNGFYFVFGTKEYSASFSSSRSSVSGNASSVNKDDTLDGLLDDNNQQENTVITAWVLDQITSPTGDMITFSYLEGANFSMPVFSGSVGFEESVTELDDDVGPTYQSSDVVYTASMSVNYTHYLDKISGRFGEVDFVSTDDRRDLITGSDLKNIYPGSFHPTFATFSKTSTINRLDQNHGVGTSNYQLTGRRLNEVKIKDLNGTVIKTVDFIQSYFEDDRLGDSDEAAYLRLKLDRVDINDISYSFDYNTPDDLPIKNTFDIDFWGFYNGASNTTHVPSIGRFCTVQTAAPNGHIPSMELGQVYYKLNGGDRSANHDFSKKGMLAKIIYPTGGYSEVEYEGNKAMIDGPAPYIVTDYIGTTNIMQWSNLLNEDNYRFTFQYLKNAVSPTYNFYDNRYDLNNSNTTETPISVGPNIPVLAPSIINGQGDLYLIYGSNLVSQYEDRLKYYVEDVNDPSNIYPLFYYGHWEGAPPGGSAGYGDESVIVPPGDYVLRRDQAAPGVAVTLSPEDFTLIEGDLGTILEEFEIGGLRVKSLETFDNNQDFISKREYEYIFPNSGSGSSSGKLMDDLIFHTKFTGYSSYTPVYPGPADSSNGVGVRITSNNNNGYPSAQGSHIGYSFVSEMNLDENGSIVNRIDRQFHNQQNSYFKENVDIIYWWNPTSGTSSVVNSYVEANSVIMLGMAPKLNFTYLNGNLISEEFYDCNSELKRVTVNEYETISINPDDQHYANFLSQGYVDDGNGSAPPWYPEGNTHYLYKLPGWYSKKAVLDRSEVVEYLENDVSYTTQYLSYDENANLTQSETVINDTRSSFEKLYYPYSSEVFNEPGMSILRGDDLWNVVVKQESYLNSTPLATREYNFDSNSNTANNARVTSIEQKKGSGPSEVRMQYEKYDSDGNVLQYKMEDGIPVSYIYGYNNQLVVAKVENATNAQLLPYASNIMSLSDADDDDCYDNGSCNEKALRTALNDLRNQSSLSDAMITTFTYNPGIGVTSITDPAGRTQYFKYDVNNRLQDVVDQDYNIVATNEYGISHYLTTVIGVGPTPVNFCGQGGFSNRTSEEEQNRVVVTRSGTVQNSVTYPNLSNHIDVTGTTETATDITYTFKAYPYGGSSGYEFRWKVKGEEFSAFSSSDTFNATFDCTQTEPSEIICEIRDLTLGTTERAHLPLIIECNNN